MSAHQPLPAPIVFVFSNGLTRNGLNVKNDLNTGVSGGQTAVGGLISGEPLFLKGNVASPAVIMITNQGAAIGSSVVTSGVGFEIKQGDTLSGLTTPLRISRTGGNDNKFDFLISSGSALFVGPTGQAGDIIFQNYATTEQFRVVDAGGIQVRGGLLTVDGNGNLTKIRNVTYSWPSSQGSFNTFLANDGSGTLSWVPVSGGASWAIGTTRFFALDPVSGDDSNLGYSDVSMAAAGAVAKQTWASLRNIIPPTGAGRIAVLAIKGPNTISESLNGFFSGYFQFHAVATSDFSDDSTDRILSGSTTGQAGPNMDGSWTVTTGGTTSVFSVAAGTLSAEPGIQLMRVRFKGNITSALTNICGTIQRNSSTQITVCDNLPASPANGDEFFIERPGVVFDAIDLAFSAPEAGTYDQGAASVLRGLAVTTDSYLQVNGDNANVSFCETRGNQSAFVFDRIGFLYIANIYIPVGGGQVRVGGCRGEGQWYSDQVKEFTAQASGALSTQVGYESFFYGITTHYSEFDGCLFRGGVHLENCQDVSFGRHANGFRNAVIDPGAASSAAGVTIVNSSNVTLQNLVITNMGAKPAIVVTGDGAAPGGGVNLRLYLVTGSTGNTDIGLDLSNAIGTQVAVVSGVSVTGTAGDIRVAGNATSYWSLIKDVNACMDDAGNAVWSIETGSVGKNIAVAHRITNKAGATMLVGHIIRSNGTSGQATLAQADTEAHAQRVLGVVVALNAADAQVMYAAAGRLGVLCDAAPTVGNILYLSEANAGKAASTAPTESGTNQKLRHGWIESAVSSGGSDYALTPWRTELLPILSDGVTEP